MESRARRGPRQPENCLPNTIVIQLVSAQPQTMPICVRAMPLLPGSKTTVEQPRRPAPPAPNRMKSPISPCPPRQQSTISSSPRRRGPTDESRYSPTQGIHTNNDYISQPLGQERTMWMEYVYHPEEQMTPIYSPPPPADLNKAGGHCCCHNCRCVRRSIPEPENFMGNQTTPRQNDTPQSCQEGRRDQSTITDDQPQYLESLKTICEALGQAIVTAAMANVQAATTFNSPAESLTSHESSLSPTMPVTVANTSQKDDQEDNEHPLLKTAFLSHIELFDDTHETTKIEHLRSSVHVPIIYPKTPIRSPLRVPTPADSNNDRMPSGSSPGVFSRSNQIIQHRPNSEVGGLPVRMLPKVNQTSAGVKVQQGPAIRRRFPTELLAPFEPENKSGPTSPTAEMPVPKKSEAEDLPQDLTVVTLPLHPDLASYSQTDDPCLSNII